MTVDQTSVTQTVYRYFPISIRLNVITNSNLKSFKDAKNQNPLKTEERCSLESDFKQ